MHTYISQNQIKINSAYRWTDVVQVPGSFVSFSCYPSRSPKYRGKHPPEAKDLESSLPGHNFSKEINPKPAWSPNLSVHNFIHGEFSVFFVNWRTIQDAVLGQLRWRETVPHLFLFLPGRAIAWRASTRRRSAAWCAASNSREDFLSKVELPRGSRIPLLRSSHVLVNLSNTRWRQSSDNMSEFVSYLGNWDIEIQLEI